MTLLNLQKKLKHSLGMPLKLTINDNRSTMLSVKWEPDCTRVSLHRMFLNAPRNVMNDLTCYLKQEEPSVGPSVKAFIEDNLKELDYSHTLDIRKLYSQGNVYNLQKILNELNREYFEEDLDLFITWFGKPIVKNRSRVIFGSYHDSLRLIKINRVLDNPIYPDYVVSYVVYHEMVHHVCPSYFDRNGQRKVHNREFKEREMKYQHFQMAQDWIKRNQAIFFLVDE